MSGDGMEYLWLTDGRAKKLLKDIGQLAPELLLEHDKQIIEKMLMALERNDIWEKFIYKIDIEEYISNMGEDDD